jgi:hypothetical protein
VAEALTRHHWGPVNGDRKGGEQPMQLVFRDDNRILCETLAAALEARGHQMLAIAGSAAEGIVVTAQHRRDICILRKNQNVDQISGALDVIGRGGRYSNAGCPGQPHPRAAGSRRNYPIVFLDRREYDDGEGVQ